MRLASGAAASCDTALRSPVQKKNAPAAVSKSWKRSKSHRARSALMIRPPANESTLKRPASFHTVAREGPSGAGVIIVLTILVSAVLAGYESVNRLLYPQPVEHLWAVAIASVIGFAGNEIVAGFRIRVGKQINSAALVADGYHARVDSLTSLGVLLSAVGVSLGYPLADPIMGLLITSRDPAHVWESGKAVLGRLLDGVDPEVIDEITHAIKHTQGVRDVTEVRLRWSGRR